MSIARPAGPITSVTTVVADLDVAIDAYRTGVGLEPVELGRVTEQRADSGGWPSLNGRRCAWLSGPGDPRAGRLEVIELPGVLAPAPLTTLGWAAAELIVADADAAAERARAAGLTILADPAPVGAGGGLRAVQVAGPAGEGLYLTEVRRPPPGFELPTALAPVGRIFIAVLASAALEMSREVLERELAARRVTDHALAVRALNAAHGLASDTVHRVSTVQLADASAIETDQYPTELAVRPECDGVPGGIVAVGVRRTGERRALRLPAAGAAVLEMG